MNASKKNWMLVLASMKKNWMLTLATLIMWFNVGVNITAQFYMGALIWTGAACLWSYLLYEKYKDAKDDERGS